MSTGFSHLLPDVIKEVASWLDTESLVALHSTFDRKLQAMLSSPNVISAISLWRHDEYELGALRYFLGSVRDIGLLKLGREYLLEPREFARFPALNPTRLVLHEHCIAPSCGDVVFPSAHTFNSSAESNIGDFDGRSLSCGLPNFGLVTPRLESLQLTCTLDQVIGSDKSRTSSSTDTGSSATYKPETFDGLNMPKSITSFTCTPSTVKSLSSRSRFLKRLPDTLLKLHITADKDELEVLTVIAENFHCLEDLRISFHNTPPFDASQLRLPPSLTNLSLSSIAICPLGPEPPSYNLGIRDLKHLKMLSLTSYSTPANKALRLSRDLPSSLTYLSLDLKRYTKSSSSNSLFGDDFGVDDHHRPDRDARPVGFIDFPSDNLTKLDIVVGDAISISFVDHLLALNKLTTLNLFAPNLLKLALFGPGDVWKPNEKLGLSIPTHCLPPSLKNLHYDNYGGKCLTKAGIETLPTGLLHLSMNAFNMELRDDLTKRAPDCFLTVLD